MEPSFGKQDNYFWAILPNGIGYYCGYVFVPEDHPRFEEDMYDNGLINAHGGITYQNVKCPMEYPHPLPKGKWIGFDCAHSGDSQSPEYIKEFPSRRIDFGGDETFKDVDYVYNEICNIILQLGLYDKVFRFRSEPDFRLEFPY